MTRGMFEPAPTIDERKVEPSRLARFAVALINPEIPPNTGNVARLCAGVGAELWVVGRPAFSLDDTHVKRAGLDYWPHVKLRIEPDIDAFFAAMVGRDIWLVETNGSQSHLDITYAPDCVLVFGSESSGIPPEILARYRDRIVSIPMPGPIRSLNLSSSVAVVVYEALRQLWSAAR